jgi:hypothetical protein
MRYAIQVIFDTEDDQAEWKAYFEDEELEVRVFNVTPSGERDSA